MTITCDNIAEFLDIIEGLLVRGIGFKANATLFEITLTGGY